MYHMRISYDTYHTTMVKHTPFPQKGLFMSMVKSLFLEYSVACAVGNGRPALGKVLGVNVIG